MTLCKSSGHNTNGSFRPFRLVVVAHQFRNWFMMDDFFQNYAKLLLLKASKDILIVGQKSTARGLLIRLCQLPCHRSSGQFWLQDSRRNLSKSHFSYLRLFRSEFCSIKSRCRSFEMFSTMVHDVVSIFACVT